jgi:hypothetical protein
MGKKNIVEDTASQFKTNVTSKVNAGDKPQKLEGEKEAVNKKAHIDVEQELPDYSAATTKDTSKSSSVAKSVGAGEQKGKLNTMPMVAQLKGDAKVVNEEDEDDSELTEEDVAAFNEHRAAVMESLAERMSQYIPNEDTPVDVTEHVNVLFEGQDLSEEFKSKATTIFEAAVRAEALTVAGSLLEAATDMVIENDMALTEAYEEKIDAALGAISESWAEANVVGIQSRLKTEITEDFIHGLAGLLREHNIMLPEDQVDVVESLTDKIMELENELNESIEANVELRNVLESTYRESVVDELKEGLTDTQASKFVSLCEAIDGSKDFEREAALIKESYFGDKSKAKPGKGLSSEETVLTESEVDTEAKMISEGAQPAKAQELPPVLGRFAPRR